MLIEIAPAAPAARDSVNAMAWPAASGALSGTDWHMPTLSQPTAQFLKVRTFPGWIAELLIVHKSNAAAITMKERGFAIDVN